MEKAIFLRRPDDFTDQVQEYDYVYFGNEFCQWLMPSGAELAAAGKWCKERDTRLVIVTPWVTDVGLDIVRRALTRYLEKNDRAELVINDLGVLKLVHDEFRDKVTPIAGRLLSNQRRDTRTLRLKEIDSKALYEHYKSSSYDYQLMIGFLNDYGVTRVEIDNLPQGIRVPPNLKGVSFSLYYPYNYVTVTRNCPFCYDDEIWHNKAGCKKKCIGTALKMECEETAEPLILKGTAMFIKNDEVSIEGIKQIDRLIFTPDIPV